MRPNLLLVSVDSLRREGLSCSTNQFARRATFPWRAHTPVMDRIARQGLLFSNCIVQAPFTPASHASFLTGLNPPRHGIRAFWGYPLNPDAETLAERLRAAGYRTAAVIGADALNPWYGLNRGFDTYDAEFDSKMALWAQGQYRRPGEEVTARALAWLPTIEPPFFLFVHFFDVHSIAPHVLAQRDPLAKLLFRVNDRAARRTAPRQLIGKLDAFYGHYTRAGRAYHLRQARRVDRQIGRLIQFLKSNYWYDQTVIAIFSDHGEAFGEHGERGHRQYLFDTTLQAPLILKPAKSMQPLPWKAGQVIPELIRSIDLAPTLYEWLGLEPAASSGYHPFDGRSLSHPSNRLQEEIVAYSETRMEKDLADLEALKYHYASVRTERWKLIVNLLDGQQQLYDLHADPVESVNCVARFPEVARSLQQTLEGISRQGARNPAQSLDSFTPEQQSEIEQRLRDLGYL